MDLDCIASLPTYVLCPTTEEVEEYEEQEEDSGNEIDLVLERRVYDSKTGIEISREKVLEGRKAEMDEMMNHHVFDEVPESEAAGKKLIRAKWLQRRQRRGRHEIVCSPWRSLHSKREARRQSRDDATAESGTECWSPERRLGRRLDDASWASTASDSHSSTRQ